MAITPYADETFGDDYMGDRLNTQEWDDADSATKAKALRHATHLLNHLNYVGARTDPDQESEFPRNGETEVPTEVKQACCEVALELLRDKFPESSDDAAGKTSESVGDASVSFDKGRTLYRENAHLPSSVAFHLIAKWLVNPRHVRLLRA